MSHVLLDAAMEYRAFGLNVIPLWFYDGNKVPAIQWKQFESQLVPQSELEKAFRKGSISGLAVILGPSSDHLVSRDWDAPGSYEKWASEYPDWAKALPTVITPRPGHHVLTRWRGLRTVILGDGELRGAGGLSVLPPSRVNGKIYRWLNQLPPGQMLLLDPAEIGLDRAWADTIEHVEQSEQVAAVKGIFSMDEAVQYALPKEKRKNNDREREFAQAVLNLENCTGRKISEDEYLAGVRQWYDIALAGGFTRHPLKKYEDEFLLARENIHTPLGSQVVKVVCAKAKSAAPPAVAVEKLKTSKTIALATFCREFQRHVGAGNTWFVSCQQVSDHYPPLLKTDPRTIWEWFNVLEKKEIVKRTDRGKRRTKDDPRGRSARFLYLPPLEDKQ